jgi:GMP synthase (glutamine-hydrolysing)
LLDELGLAHSIHSGVHGASPPLIDGDTTGIILLGGEMSANDDHLDFIRAELRYVEEGMRASIPILGICLGGQIAARVCGARVESHPEGHGR